VVVPAPGFWNLRMFSLLRLRFSFFALRLQASSSVGTQTLRPTKLGDVINASDERARQEMVATVVKVKDREREEQFMAKCFIPDSLLVDDSSAVIVGQTEEEEE